MSETNEQVPFEQRKSQNLHFADYAKSTLFWVALPVLGGIATFAGGRISRNHFNNKIWPLDGSPTLLNHLYEKAFSHVSHKATGEKIVLGEVERMGGLMNFLPEGKRLNATRDFWNFMKGTELAVIPTAFHFWRQKERVGLDLKPTHDRLKALSAEVPTDADIAADNALMKKQLEMLDAKTNAHTDQPSLRLAAGSAEHEGMVGDSITRQR